MRVTVAAVHLTSSVLPLLLLLLVVAGTNAADQKVNVSVYYEALCPDSISFVRGSMWRAYQDVPDILRLDLVPYGKASYERRADGSISFSCQHGPDECLGNMVQACALNLLQEEQRVEFVKCVMSRRRPQAAGPSCAASLGLVYDLIESCVNGREGQRYLLEMGQRTESLQPKATFVPWININGGHSDEKQAAALHNLTSVVCSAFTGPAKPAKC